MFMSHSYALCLQVKVVLFLWAVMGNVCEWLSLDDSNTILIFSSVESYDTSRCVIDNPFLCAH